MQYGEEFHYQPRLRSPLVCRHSNPTTQDGRVSFRAGGQVVSFSIVRRQCVASRSFFGGFCGEFRAAKRDVQAVLQARVHTGYVAVFRRSPSEISVPSLTHTRVRRPQRSARPRPSGFTKSIPIAFRYAIARRCFRFVCLFVPREIAHRRGEFHLTTTGHLREGQEERSAGH